MNHAGQRATSAGAERHAIGVTRMCLRSGSVQLPFALAGRLPEGELLAHDAVADEAVVLWSDPPRRLAGLAALFERHEVQVNDQLVVDVHGDDIRLSVVKRPRRSRPSVTPSTWTSMQDAPPAARREGGRDGGEAPTEAEAVADAVAHEPTYGASDSASQGRAGAAVPTTRSDARDLDRPDADDAVAPSDATPLSAPSATGPWEGGTRASAARGPGDGRAPHGPYDDAPADDDAPRAPRVRVKPLRADGRVVREATPHGTDAQASVGAPSTPRGHPLGNLLRAARGLFGGRAARREADDRGAEPPSDPPDWTRAWNEPDDAEADVAPAATFAGDAPPDARPERAVHGDAGYDDAAHDDGTYDDGTYDDGAFDDARYDGPSYDDAGFGDADFGDPGYGDADEGDAWRDAGRVRRADAHAAPPADAHAEPPRADDAGGAADEADVRDPVSHEPEPDPTPAVLPSGVPARAERFLAGDLRTRLLRFLSSPEMPLIAKTEMIARRFDLDEATAREMLEDVADDPPDGLRLTLVRDGAWRIERTGG